MQTHLLCLPKSHLPGSHDDDNFGNGPQIPLATLSTRILINHREQPTPLTSSIQCAALSWTLLIAGWSLAMADEPVLPPIVEILPKEDPTAPLQAATIRGFRLVGHTVFSDDQLGGVVAPHIGRPISDSLIEEVRRALTLHYIDHGYINSGAILEDQPVVDGVVTYRIVEGVLSGIYLKGNNWLRDQYVRDRISFDSDTPLNVLTLKSKLELLRRNQNIKALHAELNPGEIAGDSNLDIVLEEDDALHAEFIIDNYRSPSIGAERLSLLLSHTNLTGNADRLELDYGITRNGFDDVEFSQDDNFSISYELPISAQDTTLSVRYSRSDTLVIEEPFIDMNIESELQEVMVKVRHPFYRDLNTELAVAIAGERRENETFLLGDPFAFSPGDPNGENDVTVLSLSLEWVTRDQNRAFALVTTTRFGIDALDATIGGPVDGEFVTWLTFLQYIQRIGNTNNQAVLRFSSQVSDSNLLSLEQFAVGGVYSVRGYRENQVVRDNGVALSGELRLPLIHDANGQAILSFVPFVDFGYAWDENDQTNPTDIISAGAGLLFHLEGKLNAEFYWGHPFQDFDDNEDDVQDLGIHFKLTLTAF